METLGVTVPAPVPAAELVKQLREGKAVFSTNFGQYLRREAKPFEAPIIMRTDPVEDIEAMVSKLQREHSEACKAIAAPINNIYDYFDHYDVQLHGTAIIHAVLSAIAVQNSSAAMRVQEFTEYWKNRNFERFNEIIADSQDLFTVEEKTKYDEGFLKDAAMHLQKLRLGIPAMVSDATNERTYSTSNMSTLAESPVQHLLGPPTSGYMATVSMQQVPSVPLSAPPTNPIYPAHPVIQRQNSAIVATSRALVRPPSLSDRHSDTEIGNITSSHVPVDRYGEDQNPRYHSHPTVLMEHNYVRISRDTKDLQPPQDIPVGIHGFPRSTYRPVQENISFDTVQYRQPRKPSLKNGSHQQISPSGYPQNIGPIQHRSQMGFNPQIVHQFPAAIGPFPYQAIEPLQSVPQFVGSQISKPSGGNMFPHAPVRHDGHRPPPGQQYQYQGQEGIVPFPGGAMTGSVIPGPTPDPGSLQLIIPKTRGAQTHEVKQLRISPQKGFQGPSFQGLPFQGPAQVLEGNQHRGQIRGRPGDIVQSQGVPRFRIASQNGYYGPSFPEAQPIQSQSQIRGQPDLVRYRHPRMSFSNDARLLEHHDAQQRNSSWDETKSTSPYEENLQSLRGGLRRNSRGRGSRRSSFAQHAPPHRVLNYHTQEGFPASDFVRGGSSAEHSGNINTNHDKNWPHGRYSNSYRVPPETANYRVVRADKENVAIPRHEVQRLQDTKAMTPEYINRDASSFANYPASHASYRGLQTQPEWTQGGRDEYDRRIGPQRLYVGGQGSDQVDLHKLFAAYGHILEIIGPKKPKNSAERIPPFQFWFVTFKSADDAERAQLSLDNTPINHSGLYWTVRYAYDRAEKTDPASRSLQAPYIHSDNFSAEHKIYSGVGDGTREPGHPTPAKNENQTNAPLTPTSRGKYNTNATEQPVGSQNSSKTGKKGKSQKRKPSQLPSDSTPTRKERTSTSERGVSQSLMDEGGIEEARSTGSRTSSSMTQGNKTKEEEMGQEKHATYEAQSNQQQTENKVDHEETKRKEHTTPKAQFRKQQKKTSKEEKTGHEDPVTPKAKPQKHQTGRRGSGRKNEQIVPEASPLTDTGLGAASALSSSPENTTKAASDANHHQQLVSNGSPTKKPKKQGTVPKPKQNRTPVPAVPKFKEYPEGTTTMNKPPLNLVNTNPDAWPALKSPIAPSSLVAIPFQSVPISQSYRTSPTSETSKKQHKEKSIQASRSTENNTEDKVMARMQGKIEVTRSPSALLPQIETQDVSDRGDERMMNMSKTSQISSPNTAELEPISPATLVATSVSSVSPTDRHVDWAEEGEKHKDEVYLQTTALEEPKKLHVHAVEENVLVSYAKADQVDASHPREHEVYTQTPDLSGIPESRQSGDSCHELPPKPSYSDVLEAEVPRNAWPADAVTFVQTSSSTMAIKDGDLGKGVAKNTTKVEDEPSEPAKSTFKGSFDSTIFPRTNRKPLTIEPTPWIPPLPSIAAHTALESNTPLSGKPKLRIDANIKSSSLSIPSPPISTHMKKQKARTPTKEKFAKEPKVVKYTHVKASNIETPLPIDSKEDSVEMKAPTEESSAFSLVSTKDREVAVRSSSEWPPVNGPKDPSAHESGLISSSADEIRTYPSIDQANAVEDLFVPAPRQHRYQIISISLPTQSIQEIIHPEIRSAPLQMTAPESPAATTTATKKNNKKSRKKTKSRQTSASDIPVTPPPVKILEAFRPLTPPEDVPAPESDDDESVLRSASSTKGCTSTPSLKAQVNEQEASRPPTPPKDLLILKSDNGEQVLTSELSTEAPTLRESPEGSHRGSPEGGPKGNPKGSPKGKCKVTQDENVQADVPKTFSEMVAEYYEDKAEHYTPELEEKLENMKEAGASSLLTSFDILDRARSTFELPGPALAPTGYPPPASYYELSESSIEQHHATLGMSPRSNQHLTHKRHESENMSEYSTTSSVKQRKLFSEVVTSPGKRDSEKGQKTSNIIDLTGDDGDESEEDMGPPKVAVKGKGKGKGKGGGKRKGKKGNGSDGGNDEDAWKVPAGEKMWGSGEER